MSRRGRRDQGQERERHGEHDPPMRAARPRAKGVRSILGDVPTHGVTLGSTRRARVVTSGAQATLAPIAPGVERSAVPAGDQCQLGDGEAQYVVCIEHLDVLCPHAVPA